MNYKVGDDIICIDSVPRGGYSLDLTTGKLYKCLRFILNNGYKETEIMQDNGSIGSAYSDRFTNAKIKQFNDEMQEIING